jgi:FkbM family methyltransferase
MLKPRFDQVRRIVRDTARFGPGILSIALARALGRKQLRVTLWDDVGSVVLRPGDSDLDCFKQVFGGRHYDLGLSEHAARLRQFYSRQLDTGALPVIVDAGANVGAATRWFASQFPDASIFALEPDKDSAELCRQNCVGLRNVRVIEAAIGGRPGNVVVDRIGLSWAFQTRRVENEAAIPLYTVADILAMAGPKAALLIVKVDIEGFESDLFAHDTEWVADAPAIFVEPHDWLLPGKKTSQSMQSALMNQGFELLLHGQNLVFLRESLKVPTLPN